MAEREKPFHLDINFDEALRRYIGTNPREIPAADNSKKSHERTKRAPKSRRPKSSGAKFDRTD
jgi:hypothetical protein